MVGVDQEEGPRRGGGRSGGGRWQHSVYQWQFRGWGREKGRERGANNSSSSSRSREEKEQQKQKPKSTKPTKVIPQWTTPEIGVQRGKGWVGGSVGWEGDGRMDGPTDWREIKGEAPSPLLLLLVPQLLRALALTQQRSHRHHHYHRHHRFFFFLFFFFFAEPAASFPFFFFFFARALNTILTLKPLVGVGHQVGGATARVVTSSSLIDSLFMVTMGPTAWLPSSFPLAFFGSCLSFFFLRRRAGKQQQQQQQLTD